MKKLRVFLVLGLLIWGNQLMYAQSKPSIKEEVVLKESLWKGFTRYDFEVEEKEIRLIVPPTPLAGNPWVWRARFPDWHTTADSILVATGFHILFVNTDNQFGSPKAMETWDDTYQYITTKYGLHAKVVLEGVSRGGLFVYNWAKRNPEKIACIYAEAPVCDFKSWPAGFGKSKGADKSWGTLKQEYGFLSDIAARAYADNPIDNLTLLANAKIPILHMISLEDKIVPPEENTFVLLYKYLELGGIATVIPCTEGVQTLEGHHFPIETPQKVVDFIKYHTGY